MVSYHFYVPRKRYDLYKDMKKNYVYHYHFIVIFATATYILLLYLHGLIDVFLISIPSYTAAATGTSIAAGPVGPALSKKALPLLSWRKPREETILKYLQSLESEKKQNIKSIFPEKKLKKLNFLKLRLKENGKQEEEEGFNSISCNHNFSKLTLQYMNINDSLMLSLENFLNSDKSYSDGNDGKYSNNENNMDKMLKDNIMMKSKEDDMNGKFKVKNNRNSYRYVYLSRKVGNGEEVYKTLVNYLLSWQIHEGSLDTKIYTLMNKSRGKTEKLPELHPCSDLESIQKTRKKFKFFFPTSQEKDALVTLAKVTPFGGWILNPCRVSYVEKNKPLINASPALRRRNSESIVVGQYSAIGYITLKGHMLQGEEGIRVRFIRDNNNNNSKNNNNYKDIQQEDTHSVSKDAYYQHQYNKGKQQNANNGAVIVDLISVAKGRNPFVNWIVFPLVKGLQYHFFEEQIKSLQGVVNQIY